MLTTLTINGMLPSVEMLPAPPGNFVLCHTEEFHWGPVCLATRLLWDPLWLKVPDRLVLCKQRSCVGYEAYRFWQWQFMGVIPCSALWLAAPYKFCGISSWARVYSLLDCIAIFKVKVTMTVLVFFTCWCWSVLTNFAFSVSHFLPLKYKQKAINQPKNYFVSPPTLPPFLSIGHWCFLFFTDVYRFC